LIAAAILGIRWLMRQNAADRYQGEGKGDDTALDLLRQRYARGEIEAAEFEERKRTLGG
jgi:putative membrane protein